MIGKKINNYEVVRLLGEGGMGAVYLAQHPFLGRQAAIKILKPECACNAEYVRRFMNEARAANAIHHPNIIDVMDVGVLPEGVPYMMMEYLHGESLAERLRHVRRFAFEDALYVAGQIAAALAAAHAVGIIHRDLKPDNVFLVPRPEGDGPDRVKVLDFGIAKLRPEFAPDTPRTSVGALMGTPAYMSPEQCLGRTTDIDQRADIYALGIILYEMLCGRPPFVGQAFGDYLLQHATAAPPPPRSLNPGIPPIVETMILQALAKDANERIQTMAAFAELLNGGALPTTVILAEGAIPATSAPSSSATQAFGDGFLSRREPNEGAREPAPQDDCRARSADHATRPVTTLSSSVGQVMAWGDDTVRSRRGRIAVLGAIAVAVCGLAVVSALLLWRGSDTRSTARARGAVMDSSLPSVSPVLPREPSRVARQPFPPEEAPMEIAPTPGFPESPSAKSTDKVDEAPTPIRKSVPTARQRGSAWQSERGEPRPIRPGERVGVARPGFDPERQHSGPSETGPGKLEGTAAPLAPTTNVEPPVKTILREKF